MISDARKRANRTWDAANYTTVSCRMKKEQAQALRAVLVQNGLTVHTFLRRICLMAVEGELDHQIAVMRNQLTRTEQNAELDAIVRGK